MTTSTIVVYYVRSIHNKQYVSAIESNRIPKKIDYIYWHKKYSCVHENSHFSNPIDATDFANNVAEYLREKLDARFAQLPSIRPGNHRDHVEKLIKKEQKIVKGAFEIVEITSTVTERII